jgi:hypothetical protein
MRLVFATLTVNDYAKFKFRAVCKNRILKCEEYNWWSCDIDHTTDTLQIKRKFRLFPPLILIIETISVCILDCALLFF